MITADGAKRYEDYGVHERLANIDEELGLLHDTTMMKSYTTWLKSHLLTGEICVPGEVELQSEKEDGDRQRELSPPRVGCTSQ